jgi:histidine triad (HIT) family protein
MADDLFCKIASGEIPAYKVYEDEDYIAFLDINPINLGHTLIVPKEHVDYIFDLDQKTYMGLFEVARKLAIPLKQATEAARIGIAVEGFAIPHAHVHLVPLYKGNQLDPNLQHRVSDEELGAMQKKILEIL